MGYLRYKVSCGNSEIMGVMDVERQFRKKQKALDFARKYKRYIVIDLFDNRNVIEYLNP